MFKKFGFVAIVLFVAFSLCIQTFARTYVDSMTTVKSDNITSYANLDVHSFHASTSYILPDPTALSISGGVYSGHATYRATGATLVSASIYSQSGTFVSQHPDNSSLYMLGVFQENMDFLLSQNVTQALFCPATDAVYTYSGGLKQKYTDISSCFFGPVITPPSGGLVGYGVNFYYSYDGINYIYSPASQTDLKFDTSEMYFYETYAAAVPDTAIYLRVEINDVSTVPLAGGGTYPKDRALGTKLASVTLSGENLVLGAPEPAVIITVERSSDKEDSDKSDEYYDGEQSAPDPLSSASEATVPAANPVPGENAKSSSSKFEGTITSSTSSKNERASSSKQPPAIDESREATRDDTAPRETATSQEEAVVYEIARGNAEKNDAADTAINGLIISVSGAIVLRLATMAIKK